MLQIKRRPRIYYSASDRALIWDRWQKGETLHQIARLFDRSSIQRIVAETGGIRPSERHRSKCAVTLTEREEISRGVVGKLNPLDRGIARSSTVYDQPRDPTQWRPRKLSSQSSRPSGVGSVVSPEADHGNCSSGSTGNAALRPGLNIRHRKLPRNPQSLWNPESMSRKGDCWDTQYTMKMNDRPSLTRAGIG